MNRILILLASLLVVGNVYALPPCPTSGVFHNCFGTFTFTNGNEYVGEWKDDKRHGYGTFRFVDGDQHVGEYKDGKPNGQGAYTWADGDKYVGEYKDGKPWEGIEYSASGKVQETYSNGEPCRGCEPTARQLALVREIDPSLITAALPPCPTSGYFDNCFGAFTFDDGDKYVGEWKEDQLHGHGTYTWANGDKYIGEFRDGRNTYGVQYSALDRLQGTYSNGEWCEECEPNANQLALVREIDPSLIAAVSKEQRSDLAQFLSEANRTQDDYRKCNAWFYSGPFEYEGIVFQNWADVLDKQFSQWGRQSDAASELSQSCSPFLDSTRLVWIAPSEVDNSGGARQISTALPSCPTSGYFDNCFGSYTDADGNKYVGEWKTDKRHGQGTSTFADGDQHVGEWKDGKYHGYGTYTFGPNAGEFAGDKYVGEFKDGMKHGHGTYTWADGDVYVGEYKGGNPWEGIQYSASGKVQGTYSNGEPCRGCEPTARQLALVREIDPSHIVGSDQWCASYPSSVACKQTATGSESNLRLSGTGTGFAVNPDYVVTADHVLDGCNEVAIVHAHQKTATQTVARDRSNDLGLLRLDKTFLHTAKLRGGRSIRLGERVSNYGYPLFGDISTSATITEGNINNLSGLGNDSTVMQFDAPTQPGNSGGPVLDSSGNVVGVAIYILSKEHADATGHIAQNVNFAVKSTIVENFLQSNNVPFERADPTEKFDLPDLAEKAETFTVLVECWE